MACSSGHDSLQRGQNRPGSCQSLETTKQLSAKHAKNKVLCSDHSYRLDNEIRILQFIVFNKNIKAQTRQNQEKTSSEGPHENNTKTSCNISERLDANNLNEAFLRLLRCLLLILR